MSIRQTIEKSISTLAPQFTEARNLKKNLDKFYSVNNVSVTDVKWPFCLKDDGEKSDSMLKFVKTRFAGFVIYTKSKYLFVLEKKWLNSIKR